MAAPRRRTHAAATRRARPRIRPAPRRSVAAAPREATGFEYRRLFDLAPVIWMVVDGNGIILDINTGGGEALQAKPRFIVGTPLRMWLSAASRPLHLEHFRRCRESDGVVETTLTLKDTTAGPGAIVRFCSRRSRHDGQVVFPSVAIDISEQEHIDRQRVAAERQRDLAEQERLSARAAEKAKDRLIATVSHELRNPLSPALMAASNLANWPGLPDRARHMAAIIKRNIQLEARLIDDLLDVARATRGQMDLRLECVDVHDPLRRAIQSCAEAARAKQVTISTDLRADPRHVRADEARLQQVFWNLLHNAIKFSPAEGQVTVRTSTSRESMVVVSVRDFGSGIDAATLRKLFSPFDHPRGGTDSRAGLGLGLSIARSIVELHGGQIWASSEGPGRGSTFEVDLPVARSLPGDVPVSAPAVPVPPAVGSPARGRALVVEDHEDAASVLALCLSQEGYDVTVVSTLAEGLAALRAHFDVVVSDVGLGDGSGLDIARSAVTSPAPPAHLIALSGYGAQHDIQASRDAGFDHHLVKPIDPARLLQLLA